MFPLLLLAGLGAAVYLMNHKTADYKEPSPERIREMKDTEIYGSENALYKYIHKYYDGYFNSRNVSALRSLADKSRDAAATTKSPEWKHEFFQLAARISKQIETLGFDTNSSTPNRPS
jgi:hypothetical protein